MAIFGAKKLLHCEMRQTLSSRTPHFHFFREFIAWIVEGDKKFSIIGNMNAITYREVFPLIKSNKVWLGNNYKINGGAMFVEIPRSHSKYGSGPGSKG